MKGIWRCNQVRECQLRVRILCGNLLNPDSPCRPTRAGVRLDDPDKIAAGVLEVCIPADSVNSASGHCDRTTGGDRAVKERLAVRNVDCHDKGIDALAIFGRIARRCSIPDRLHLGE